MGSGDDSQSGETGVAERLPGQARGPALAHDCEGHSSAILIVAARGVQGCPATPPGRRWRARDDGGGRHDAPLSCDALQTRVQHGSALLPGSRQDRPPPPDTRHDAACGAWGLCGMPSPTCLADPRQRPASQGRTHAQTVRRIPPLPCAPQSRPRLEPLAPPPGAPRGGEVWARLAPPRRRARVRVLKEHLWGALEGTPACASSALPGPQGRTRQRSHGPLLDAHPARTPAGVGPICIKL